MKNPKVICFLVLILLSRLGAVAQPLPAEQPKAPETAKRDSPTVAVTVRKTPPKQLHFFQRIGEEAAAMAHDFPDRAGVGRKEFGW
jgi:hypothetical protein